MGMQQDLNLTERAEDAFFDMETNPKFQDQDQASKIIWEEVKKRIPTFSSYLKRYINSREGISWDDEKPLNFYQDLIVYEFQRRGVPVSFDPTSSTSPKVAVKNWLTRRTVSRKTVFLLGFGLKLKPETVDYLLTKGICEQGINPKDPFEVICWYCYQFDKDFSFFNALMQRYEQLPAIAPQWGTFSVDATVNIRNSMYGITGPQELFDHLATLKTSTNIPRISRTATNYFVQLYDSIAQNIAQEKRITKEQVTDEMIQDLLYELGIGKTEQNNLLPENESDLHDVFNAKRLNRQRIGKLHSGKEQVTRYDLLTMNFLLHTQMVFNRSIHRYSSFVDKTNEMLIDCALQEITIQNAYEFFILACLRTDDPLLSYWNVWEYSIYGIEE